MILFYFPMIIYLLLEILGILNRPLRFHENLVGLPTYGYASTVDELQN